ncbi:MAG TPA: hypothetical protein VMV77_18765 [Bacteroidales bacterium]|nr:hypothetical protein [Bacteroidales bacterium]
MKTVKSAIFFLSFFSLLISSANCQIVVPASEGLLDKMRLNKSINGIRDVPYSSITGDPYLYGDFHSGKFILTTGETINLDLRYDIYADQIQIKDKNNTLFELVHLERLSLIVIDTIKFVYSEIQKSRNDKAPGKAAFFILKSDGKCRLLAKKNIRIQNAELPKAYQGAKSAKFIHTDDTYYLKLEDKNAVRAGTGKDLLKILSDNRDEVARFIDSNRLGTKKEDDLVKIISFYNSLF